MNGQAPPRKPAATTGRLQPSLTQPARSSKQQPTANSSAAPTNSSNSLGFGSSGRRPLIAVAWGDAGNASGIQVRNRPFRQRPYSPQKPDRASPLLPSSQEPRTARSHAQPQLASLDRSTSSSVSDPCQSVAHSASSPDLGNPDHLPPVPHFCSPLTNTSAPPASCIRPNNPSRPLWHNPRPPLEGTVCRWKSHRRPWYYGGIPSHILLIVVRCLSPTSKPPYHIPSEQAEKPRFSNGC